MVGLLRQFQGQALLHSNTGTWSSTDIRSNWADPGNFCSRKWLQAKICNWLQANQWDFLWGQARELQQKVRGGSLSLFLGASRQGLASIWIKWLPLWYTFSSITLSTDPLSSIGWKVSITPEVTSRKINRAVMEQLIKLYEELIWVGSLLPTMEERLDHYLSIQNSSSRWRLKKMVQLAPGFCVPVSLIHVLISCYLSPIFRY